jgi:hypothetical protein
LSDGGAGSATGNNAASSLASSQPFGSGHLIPAAAARFRYS